MSDKQSNPCQNCHASGARLYELYSFATVGEPVEPQQSWLCVQCARRERQSLREARATQPQNPIAAEPHRITRAALITALDRFWTESGAGEICRRCHIQGTGCCPPMCRHLGAAGCLQKNVFCTSFVCSALLNAISECDPATGRLLKWVKRNPGAAEYRIYEMVTRVPAIDRELARPLAVPEHYPGPLSLAGEGLKESLRALTEEVLEVRRRWQREELEQLAGLRTEE